MELNNVFKSPLRAKIIKFYNKYPSAIETSRDIALWLGADRQDAKKALEELTRYKILIAHNSSVATGYSYTQHKTISTDIEKYLKKHNIDKEGNGGKEA